MSLIKDKRKAEESAGFVEKKKSVIVSIPDTEVIKRLRNLKQPIRLFGETNDERLDRLKAAEANADFSTVAETSSRNEFRKIWEKTSAGLAEEQLSKSKGPEKKAENPYNSIDTQNLSPKLLETDMEQAKRLLAAFLKKTLFDWEQDIAAQPEDIKQSTAGKLAMVSQKQSAEAFKYLFKQLKKNLVSYNVLERLTEICQLVQQREYMAANDTYLRLSIGNAPWPIGVTRVGIHERSAREKISSSQVAHVLNDEATRKWIQSVKRLMTWCQKKYPPDDLSKCVG